MASFTGEEEDYEKLRMRAIKVAVHELGHCFGLLHCIHYDCVMNGSNHLENTDSRPVYFCPVCYRKLWFCLKFDHLERYKKLV
jgi:archaemetzincin